MSIKNDASSDKTGIEETPVVPGQGDLGKIRKVDLSLHGDGISHWQDEPQPEAGDADRVRDKERG